MPMEIEWVFALRRLPQAPREGGISIRQGYFTDTSPSVRVRIIGGEGKLTIKAAAGAEPGSPAAGGPCVRQEFEYEIPPDDAAQLLALARWRIEKTRYTLPGGLILDVFHGRHAGLVIAEYETAAAGEPPPAPPPGWDWLDVSQDPRYCNQSLAIHGLPPGAPLALA